MNSVVDEVLSGNARYRLSRNGVTIYDDVIIEQTTPTQVEGTALDKLLFDSILADLNSRLLISSKATQTQAEGGTDNTNYMTPLRVKNFCDENVGLKKTKLSLSTSGTTELTLSDYLTDNTEKLEILINARMSSSYSGIVLAASRIVVNDSGEGVTWVSTRKLGDISQVSSINGKLEIYPDSVDDNDGTYIFNGWIQVNNSGSPTEYTEIGTFENISTLTIGKSTTNPRHTYQVTIYQHLR